MAFEKFIIPTDNDPKMGLHLFVAILSEFLQGNKTGAESKTAIEDHLGVNLSVDETSDITAVISYINGGADTFEKRNRLDELYRVLILAESETYFTTKELLKNRLGWL